ncbi:bifunctional metallophosphatase/5'-nucleotidase [Clostridium sp. SYSU_GA19001]|uniref:bifunctional metallophosphatase/5'-nucleotidase n=1 Tax=Clostridium caldaquaticum TaxID=2940653 RepID=UPI002076F58F|nr:bifunctional UDP-sugar hydrolase/5'-nucleotidase [Clostridium caldaquaticum]MCM8711855.1 bifunctional metallophosphatase/5'-nucleotidase [Clostridium caldaquaticum]
MVKGSKVKITILETSDIHGNILSINYGNNEKRELGLCRISTLIKKEIEKNSNRILIDNGDLIQGTPITYYYARIDSEKENPVIKVLNYLNYDAAVIGNHEFNYGDNILKKVIKQSSFPWLSANIIQEDTGREYTGKAYIVKEFEEGIKAGILGLTTKYIPNWENPNHIKGLKFQDPVEYAKKWVKILREVEKVDLVIVCYHGGIERNIDTGKPIENLTGENQGYELCKKVDGIDILLTGHQHRLISGKKINNVIVLQPGSQGQNLGKVEITLEKTLDRWKICDENCELLSVEGVIEDENVIKLVKEYEDKTQAWLDKPIGKIKGDMTVKDPMEVRIKDNPLIEFINKVQMEYSGADISNTALFSNQSPGFPSDVTMRDIVSNYIYPNTLKVIRIKGRDIKEALERSASYFEKYKGGEIKVNSKFCAPKPQHYNYDMWEGIDYVINISKDIGERVVKLEYKGKPLDMEKEYEVVMNNYRAGGGGEYTMFQDNEVVKEITTDVSELIANYILERGTIEATVNNNWKVIYD